MINEQLNVWKADRVRETFLDRDMNQILSIPISSTWMQDRRIWRRTMHGNFTVKTAYVIAKEVINRHRPNAVDIKQTSGAGMDDDKWQWV